MANRVDYYTVGTTWGKDAADTLTDTQLTVDQMFDSSHVTAMADSLALIAAEGNAIKKTTATFFSAFKSAFLNAIRERQRVLTEKAKPVFWGTKDSQRAAFEGKDTRLWTLCSVMDDIKGTQRDVAQHLESLIRDAQKTLERIRFQQEAETINDRLYPVYDENLGQMGIRVDVGIARLRQLQESTRTMIGLCGMRLPSKDELAAGPTNEEEAR